ncbi:MAG: type IV secretion protein Rhs [Dehalococcoidia bacterium]|nr:type IV secretion protein Rhs [Dehalococcoidia bacterium]
MTAIIPVPRVVIEAEGAALSDFLSRTLSALRVQQRLSQPALCELTFTELRGPLDVAAELKPGTALRVLVNGQDAPLFDGQVTALEYLYSADNERLLRVRAYDLLHQLRKRQTVRAHVQVTVSDLASELVADTGLSVKAEVDGPMWPHLVQHRQSDFELLVAATERCGLFLTVREDSLHLITLEGIGDAVSLMLGQNLIEARVEVNGDSACREVNASSWDPALVKPHTGSAGSPRVGRDIGIEVAPDSVGGSGSRELVDESAPDDSHAEALAQAELDLRVAREVTFHGLANGNTGLRAGTPVEVEGLADELNGTYVLTSVTHTFDSRSGFVSQLSTEPPAPAPRPHAAVATIGIVTRVDDPEELGRVCVALPTYGDVETPWLGVVLPAAGPSKGLIALPDVDDQVVVLSLDGDPGRGFVLGGVYGSTTPPDTGVEGSAVKRYTFTTPGGQLLRLDDEGNLLRLETSSGNFLEFTPRGMRLHAASALTIEAPGQRIRIRGQAIDFERA